MALHPILIAAFLAISSNFQLSVATDLAPAIGNETVTLHHAVHGAASLATLNSAILNTSLAGVVGGGSSLPDLEYVVVNSWMNGMPIKGVFNGAAQTWNHIQYFGMLKKYDNTTANEPTGPLANAIVNAFGSFSNFTTVFKQAGTDRFGSGWVWLLYDKDCALSVASTPNGENYLAYNNGRVSIMTMDVWEHSYYLDYRNLRASYMSNFMTLIDWNKVALAYPTDPNTCATNAAPKSTVMVTVNSTTPSMTPSTPSPPYPISGSASTAVSALLGFAALAALLWT